MTRHLTIERAQGRWREILPRLGIETRYLRNRQGPCPMCGGKTRFRFDDLNGNGTFYCNHCGTGASLHLIRKLKGWDFATACREVDRIIANRPAALARPRTNGWRQPIRDIRKILEGATDHPGVVTRYLTRRGLSVTSPVLLGHPPCPYWEDGKLIGRFPATIAPLIDPNGVLQSLHRIYDADIEPRKKTMKPVSTINGAAARLFEPTDELGIAEGCETALACFELFGVPTWAAISDNGITTFVPPPGIRRIIIFADHDANYVGQAAAYVLAKRLTREGHEVEVRIPPIPDTDWLDVLHGRQW
jgi:putative DNA primase/helicase